MAHNVNPQHIDAPPEKQRLLSLAAMFQGNFSIDWICKLTDSPPSMIITLLEEGSNEGWLVRKAPGEYRFSDKKKQTEFLKNIDDNEKEKFHQSIADLFLKNFANDERMIQTASRHLLHTSNNIEQCSFLMQAADSYTKSYHTKEALECYFKILEDLSGTNGDDADNLFIPAAINFSKISLGRYDTHRVLNMLQEALGRAENAHKRSEQALIKLHLAKNEWLRGQEDRSFHYFQEGWSMVKEIGNPSLLRSAVSFRIHYFWWQGLLKNAIAVYEEFVPNVEKFPHDRLPLWATLLAGWCYGLCGQTTQGLGLIDAIQTHCRERGDRIVAIHAQHLMGQIMLDVGHNNEALHIMESTLKEANRENAEWERLVIKPVLAFACHLNNDHKRTVTLLNQYMEESRQVSVELMYLEFLMKLGWDMEQGKLPQISGLSLEKITRHCIHRSQNVLNKGVAYRYQAYLQKRDGLSSKSILTSLKNSEKHLIESGHQNELIRTRLDMARCYLLSDQEEMAKKTMDFVARALTPMNENLIPDDLKPLIKKQPKSEHLLKEILRLGQETVTIRDNKQLIQHIISMVNRITGAERGAIFLLDEISKPVKFELIGSKGLPVEDVENESFGLSMRMIKKVAASGKGRVESADAAKSKGDSTGRTIRSRVCVPLIFRDKVIGTLYHDNRILSSAFKDSDLELLAYFAAQAAIALKNSEEYERMKQHNLQLIEEKQYYEDELLHNRHFADIIGESKAIKNIISQIDQVADSDATVLILGETGVGKELVASAIHAHSPRKDKPFIRVQCSALPESLIPSELFGHEKGAFTGAVRRKIGRFELANGGTLLLDEIGDLSLDVQVRLLRVLQTKEFERIGGDDTIRSDFRLIAATNRNLIKAVDDGGFRSDLYYRLNVFPIFVPPLRDRSEDIPALAYYFLKTYSDKMGKTFDGIDNSDMNRLLKYNWPGNIRELENVIERGAILSHSPDFMVPELIHELHKRSSKPTFPTFTENERRHIIAALQQTNWKVSGTGGAAELLDLKRTTLDYKMKKLGISRSKSQNYK